MPEFIDTHAHIQGSEFADDRHSVIEAARAAGVTSMIVPAVDLETARSSLALAQSQDGIYATAGYHPHEASLLDDENLRQVEELLGRREVVAVGEIGLDWFRMLTPRQQQLDTFEKMLDLAERHVLPVVLHCRDAWEDFAAILPAWAQRVAARYDGQPLGVLHYFTGDVAEARRYIDLGFYVSVHTSITHPKATGLREVAAALPLSSLVIETDSPYGAPQIRRGRRNEPALVAEAARQIAQEKQISFDDVASATTANARRLFRLPVPAATNGGATR
jgi:TatD DNase family protein